MLGVLATATADQTKAKFAATMNVSTAQIVSDRVVLSILTVPAGKVAAAVYANTATTASGILVLSTVIVNDITTVVMDIAQIATALIRQL